MVGMGNITVKMDGKEDTYAAGSIEAKRYGKDAISLKFTSGDGRASAEIRFAPQDCKELISKLVNVL